ncbi:N-alpha-acetyltransferase 15, NatA auxiliary subunit [Artemisia annua]|uniref:N-alpha-acetyltransferase 15, NatA auxiliary subunit n=1 Tax=Artemisia annua TaxID=35608 RepID=A0A2U1Q4F2_ARTAN|nr:N-alpha-acetyltransferase 15, NatA auxiliary subunit [Artemisia annua]
MKEKAIQSWSMEKVVLVVDLELKDAQLKSKFWNTRSIWQCKNCQEQQLELRRKKPQGAKAQKAPKARAFYGIHACLDPDPHGEKLLQTEDPLLEAGKYLKLLQKHSSDSLETHLLLLKLGSEAVTKIGCRKPKLSSMFVKNLRFFHKVASRSAPATDGEKLILGVIEAERPTFSRLKQAETHKNFRLKSCISELMRAETAAEIAKTLIGAEIAKQQFPFSQWWLKLFLFVNNVFRPLFYLADHMFVLLSTYVNESG